MNNLFVTVVETPKGISIPEVDSGLCSEKHAIRYANLLNKNSAFDREGITARVGVVCMGNIDDLLTALLPAPVWNGIDSTKKDEYRDFVKAWMNG